ncbi:MAG: biotin--[acetyl-CoA-carboxylase] ligase [Campylobacterota bacterium]|nr:biotin--[acetyl-CoA-carboxylase] ligase [Campylobacterota bacterium]
MKILWLNEVDSTQTYLLEALKSNDLKVPIAVVAKRQNCGKGSRENEWIGLDGNLFVSFAISKSSLPNDLRLESTSIYLSMILKELLFQLGSKAWLKWPNDFYIDNKKVGGTITNVYKNCIVCGIGLNIKVAPQGSSVLDINVEIGKLLNQYFNFVKSCQSWKQIFSKFELEFDKSRKYFTHIENEKVSLVNVTLQDDGSIEYDGKKVYSLR